MFHLLLSTLRHQSSSSSACRASLNTRSIVSDKVDTADLTSTAETSSSDWSVGDTRDEEFCNECVSCCELMASSATKTDSTLDDEVARLEKRLSWWPSRFSEARVGRERLGEYASSLLDCSVAIPSWRRRHGVEEAQASVNIPR